MKYCIATIWNLLLCIGLCAQCDAVLNAPQSARLANYKMSLSLDHVAKKSTGTQEITFTNHSDTDTIYELRFYMYLNAFKNTNSTWIKGSGRNTFGQDLTQRKQEDWGWVELLTITDEANNPLHLNKKYIQPDDGNTDDESVLLVPLKEPILPGETVAYSTTFESRLPRTIARSGWGHNDFFLWVHWYPKLGVWEQDNEGQWGWNCHQFMRQTEFYGEFGVYDVTLTYSEHLVVGSSGCLVSETKNDDGTITRNYLAEDVIDYAWCAYPHFEVIKDQWKHVEITLLSPPEHRSLQPRFMKVVKESLEYMEVHAGLYPYTTITIMDPPLVGLRNGFMEYPTLSTGGSFYGFPKGIRTIESLIVHEFVHQYFMAIMANNEKEEPWLDEGFVVYFEDRIMEEYYGENCSLFDILGFRIGNSELSRNEYTSMDNPRENVISPSGEDFMKYTRTLVYGKTGTTLQSIRRMYGQEVMDKLMRTYFNRYKFTHPRGHHFFSTAREVISEEVSPEAGDVIEHFLHQAIYTSKVCDYAIRYISLTPTEWDQGLKGERGKEYVSGEFKGTTSTVLLERKGDFITPVDILITMEDGQEIWKKWDGKSRKKELIIEGRVQSAYIDPLEKIQLDINLNNNSYTRKKITQPIKKYSWKASTWVQHIFQSLSFLM